MTAEILVPWPRLVGTIAEWEALPPLEGVRVELVEGVPTYMAAPRLRHQRCCSVLPVRLDEQLPGALTGVAGLEVILVERPLTIRVPDVVVTPSPDGEFPDLARLPATDVRVVVEVLSDGTRKIDRILKFAEYAEAGIPRYWIVDVDDPVTLWSYVLVDGHYELAGECTGIATLEIDGHPIRLDLEALVRR